MTILWCKKAFFLVVKRLSYLRVKVVKIHPDADPEFDSNWRFINREYFEAGESSYYESDVGDPDFDPTFLESGNWRRVGEDDEDSEDEDNEDDGEDDDDNDNC